MSRGWRQRNSREGNTICGIVAILGWWRKPSSGLLSCTSSTCSSFYDLREVCIRSWYLCVCVCRFPIAPAGGSPAPAPPAHNERFTPLLSGSETGLPGTNSIKAFLPKPSLSLSLPSLNLLRLSDLGFCVDYGDLFRYKEIRCFFCVVDCWENGRGGGVLQYSSWSDSLEILFLFRLFLMVGKTCH